MPKKSTLVFAAKLLPAYLIIALILFIAFYQNFHKTNVARAQISKFLFSVKVKPSSQIVVLSGVPTEIIIPKSNIKVSVKPGNYDAKTKQWEINKDNAFYMTLAALPNSKEGNTVIYAHNTGNLFGPLDNLKPGDLAYIKTGQDSLFVYKYISDEEVLPTDISVLKYQGEPRLTLMTCAGLTNNVRRLMTFKFLGVI